MIHDLHCTMAHMFSMSTQKRVFLRLNLSGAFDAMQPGPSDAFTMTSLPPFICYYRGSNLRLNKAANQITLFTFQIPSALIRIIVGCFAHNRHKG